MNTMASRIDLNQRYMYEMEHPNYSKRTSTSTKRSRHVTCSSSGGSAASLASFARNSFASSMTSWQSQRDSVDRPYPGEKIFLAEEESLNHNDLDHDDTNHTLQSEKPVMETRRYHHKGPNDPAGQSELSAFIDEVLGECDFPALPKTPKSASSTDGMDVVDCYTQSPSSSLPACRSLVVPKEKLDFIMSEAGADFINSSPASTARTLQNVANDNDISLEEGQDGYIILGPPLEYKNFTALGNDQDSNLLESPGSSNRLSRKSSAHLSSSRSAKSGGSELRSPASSFSLRKTLGTKTKSNLPGKKLEVSIPYNFVHVNHIDSGRDFGPAGREIQLSSFPSVRPEQQQQRPALHNSKSQPFLGEPGFANNWRKIFSSKKTQSA